jgi:hypothetical protein
MTSREHYREAEALLQATEELAPDIKTLTESVSALVAVAMAQAHATLALAAATERPAHTYRHDPPDRSDQLLPGSGVPQ